MPLIFDKKEEVGRQEFIKALRKKIKGKTHSPKYSFQEKMKIVKKIFGPTYIEKISQDDYKKNLRKMERLKLRTRDEESRKAVDEKLKFLLKLGGMRKKDLKSSNKKQAINELKQAKEEKDTSVFTGPYGKERMYASVSDRRNWLRKHSAEVWKITKGRVTSAKIPQYDAKLHPKKWGVYIEKHKREPERIKKEMQKAYWKAKTDKEKWEIKRDIEVVDKMYGLRKK